MSGTEGYNFITRLGIVRDLQYVTSSDPSRKEKRAAHITGCSPFSDLSKSGPEKEKRNPVNRWRKENVVYDVSIPLYLLCS
jgi:hypothetical protein